MLAIFGVTVEGDVLLQAKVLHIGCGFIVYNLLPIIKVSVLCWA